MFCVSSGTHLVQLDRSISTRKKRRKVPKNKRFLLFFQIDSFEGNSSIFNERLIEEIVLVRIFSRLFASFLRMKLREAWQVNSSMSNANENCRPLIHRFNGQNKSISYSAQSTASKQHSSFLFCFSTKRKATSKVKVQKILKEQQSRTICVQSKINESFSFFSHSSPLKSNDQRTKSVVKREMKCEQITNF